ncbi:hypothetical protein MYAM1_001450 [Malassezia yamatoensis]|uniref:Large ribosomal subunit protein mL46 n=1 Tax=Malassezia yamatoensis TaxID=253288 RepID=A0AAJ5YQG0_9BASI|nr:hypothetical protein MYAM1_001450 [Malassezia yamatoensis]
MLRSGPSWGTLARGRRAASTAAKSQNTQNHALKAALLLVRAPVVQKEPTAFEQEFYRFNRELSQKLQQPFPRDMYFKKGSAAEKRFDEFFNEFQKTWELKTDTKKESGAIQQETPSESDADLYATMPRTTSADAQKNRRSLERALDRTLYLLVKDKENWRLPSSLLAADRSKTDSLHDAALSGLKKAWGDSMDLWLVSKLPAAVVEGSPKTYILRARVLAGEPMEKSGQEYAWLTKEEVADYLQQDTSEEAKTYWTKVQDLMDE